MGFVDINSIVNGFHLLKKVQLRSMMPFLSSGRKRVTWLKDEINHFSPQFFFCHSMLNEVILFYGKLFIAAFKREGSAKKC